MDRINKLAETGRFDGAIKLTEELLADEDEKYSAVDPWALRELASNVYTAVDRHSDARPLLEQMLVIAQQHSAEDLELQARSRYLLAACIIRLAEAAEASAAPPADAESAPGYSGTVVQHATLERWNLTQQAVSHLRAAIAANPQHGDAKYFLALQLMKSARGHSEAAQLLSSIALASPQDPRTVFDFSPVDVLLLAGQAHEKVGNLSQAAASFHNGASWYATASDEQWEVDNAQQFKFGLAYYNLARMLDLQHMWAEALQVVKQGLEYFPAVWHLIDMHAVVLDALGQHEKADNVYQEAFDTMKEWPLEWKAMPQRVFSSTLAWLRLRRMGGHGGGSTTDKHEPEIDGGWGAADSDDVASTSMRQYELKRCDIARRSASEMTVAEFHRDFADTNRPVLITGAMAGWPAWQHWTKQGLLRKYGEQSVQVRRSSAIATDAEFGGQHARNMTVAEFVRTHMASLAAQSDQCTAGSSSCEEQDDPEYMFAQDPLHGLRDDYGAPAFFEDKNRYGYSREERAATALFYVGPAGSGVNFHQHTNAWNALFFGRKRWFLFPPNTIYGPTALPMTEWYRNFYPQLKGVAVECVQEAGEMLYVVSMPGEAGAAVLCTLFCAHY